MRFKYSTNSPSQNEFDSLPRVPLLLRQRDRVVEIIGLVDSGATINVLPYEIGLQLGSIWDERKAIIRLTGNLGNQQAIPFSLVAQIGEFEPVKLVFAWTNNPNAPLILGQTNFFLNSMFVSTVPSQNLKCNQNRKSGDRCLVDFLRGDRLFIKPLHR